MNKDELTEYEKALRIQTEVEISTFEKRKKAELQVKICEARLKMLPPPQPSAPEQPEIRHHFDPQIETYIDINRRYLEQDQIDFLRLFRHPPNVVAEFLGNVLEKTVRNRLNGKGGKIRYRPSKHDTPGHRDIDPISVIETLIINGDPEA